MLAVAPCARACVASAGGPRPYVQWVHNRRLKKKEREYLRLSGHKPDEKKFPTVSKETEVFEAQQRVFGYQEADSGGRQRRKDARWARIAESLSTYYPPTLENVLQTGLVDLKRVRRELRAKGDAMTEEDKEHLHEIETYILPIFRHTEQQELRLQKVQALKRRGKGPPAKGQGKRASK